MRNLSCPEARSASCQISARLRAISSRRLMPFGSPADERGSVSHSSTLAAAMPEPVQPISRYTKAPSGVALSVSLACATLLGEARHEIAYGSHETVGIDLDPKRRVHSFHVDLGTGLDAQIASDRFAKFAHTHRFEIGAPVHSSRVIAPRAVDQAAQPHELMLCDAQKLRTCFIRHIGLAGKILGCGSQACERRARLFNDFD